MNRILLLALSLVLAIPALGAAQQNDNGQRADQEKVTGGGQVVVDSNGLQGAGDTLAFVAISTSDSDDDDSARGEFRHLETSEAGNNGGPPEKFFGQVTCLTTDGDEAQFGGFERERGPNGNGTQAFTVDVQDNGPDDDDLILFRETDEPCDDDGDPDDRLVLARGNLTVHNGNG